MNHFFKDRWKPILIYFAIFLFLIVAIKRKFSVAVQVLLPLIGVLAVVIIIRTGIFYFRPESLQDCNKKGGRWSVWKKVWEEYMDLYVRFIGYLILLAIILGPAFEGRWAIYILIGLFVIAALIQLLEKK